MARVSEGIGKTYDEAVQDGLNKIGLSKNEVSIEIVKEPKKTFFSILEPRQVKVTITEKEKVKTSENPQKVKEIVELDKDDLENVKNKIRGFLSEYLSKLEVLIRNFEKENSYCSSCLSESILLKRKYVTGRRMIRLESL